METNRLNLEKRASAAGNISKYIKGFKNFSDTNTFKFLNSAKLSAEKGGFKGLLDHVSKYKEPARHLGKEIPKKMKTMKTQGVEPTLARGVRTSLGNSANAIKELSKGLKGKNPISGAGQFLKNTKNLTKKEVKGDLYKEIENPILYRKGKDKFVKTKAPFFKDRKVVSETDRGGAVVRKRKGLTPFSVGLGMSGASVGGATYALGDKDQSQTKRISNSVIDGGLWAVSPPVGMASAFMRGSDSKKVKKKKDKLKEKKDKLKGKATKRILNKNKKE